jgi:tripartite-type tricarboxylate transporter receptor subunit TctC
MKKIRILACALSIAVYGLASGAAGAAYPDKPIKLILPFVAGGSSDLVARAVAVKAQAILGQTIVIDNRGGGGGIVATSAVAKAEPDGYTLLFAQTSHAANPSLIAKLPYDTEKDFTPIALLADHPGVIVANPSKPYKTFAEFLAYTKANPGKVVYASAGVGTWPHLTMELLSKQAGLKMVHVPYKGASASRTDLITGRIDVKVEAFATTSDYIKDGRMRAIAVTGKERIADIPDVPTVAESGFPGFESSIWMGVLGPVGMPADVVSKLERAFTQAAQDPDVVKDLKQQGIYARGKPGKDLAVLIHTDIAKWHAVVKAAGIVAE